MKRLYVVGLGPGASEQMTIRAAKVLSACDVIVGYTLYVDLIRAHFPGKEFVTTPMRQEAERCRLALKRAAAGQTTAVVCSGDAGIYGMSGLVLELQTEYPDVDVEIVPGVPAAGSGGALLAASLVHDFAVISISDLLTPWDKNERRLLAAAEADFVLCLYNPSSKKRGDYLQKACDLLLRHKAPETVCAVAENIGRAGEGYRLCTLAQLAKEPVDMMSTVFIGNAETKIIEGKMVTPRGYKL